VLVDKPWINPQGRQATAQDLRSSLDLLMACTTLAGAAAALLLFLARGWL
jgi:cobalamin biosynthesis protein CobD/CbiB